VNKSQKTFSFERLLNEHWCGKANRKDGNTHERGRRDKARTFAQKDFSSEGSTQEQSGRDEKGP
jgi:hypothetical protein